MLCGLPRLPLRALPALGWLLLRLVPPSPSGAPLVVFWTQGATVFCANPYHAERLSRIAAVYASCGFSSSSL